MNNNNIINKVIIVALMFVVIFAFKGCYTSKDTSYTFEFDSMDSGLVYQVFYTTEESPAFSEAQSVTVQTKGTPEKFEHYEVNIPTASSIIDLRLDFGTFPGELKIANVVLVGETEVAIPLETIADNFNIDVESFELSGTELKIISNLGDPYSYLAGINATTTEKNVIDYVELMDLCIRYLMIVIVGSYIFSKVTKKKEN